MLGSVNLNLYKELDSILPRKQEVFEILYTYHGLKEVTRLTLNKKELERIQKICEIKNQFSLVTQNYKFNYLPDKGKLGFQNKAKKVPIENKNGHYITYISKSKVQALRAKKYEANNQHGNFGEILGYPECCVDFFERNIKEQSKKQMDFVLPALKEFGVYPYVNNIAIRYFGISILNHFPCGFDCEKSKKLGEKYLEIIKKYDPPLAKRWIKNLKSFVLYTEYDGVFYSPQYSINDNKIEYGEIKSTVNSGKIYELFTKNNEVKIENQNNFEIGGKKISGGDYGILAFK